MRQRMRENTAAFVPGGNVDYVRLPLHSFRRSICASAETPRDSRKHQRVLVLGGTGRVGTETIKALSRITPEPLSVTVAGRDRSRGDTICRQLTLDNLENQFPVQYTFSHVDINDEANLSAAITAHDLVVHTAGPFQRKEKPDTVLKAAMTANVPYMDVCDDLTHAVECKKLHEHARENGYVALISTGIYPGLSNLMAADAVRVLREEGVNDIESLQLFYHTAGTGGIGATVLASTFLILSEKAVCYDSSGQKVLMPAAGAPEIVDFQGRIGKKTAYLLNLPEVVSLREYLLGACTNVQVSAKFSTGPPIWNWLLQAMAKWTPNKWLANRGAMQAFSRFSLPIVKAVDFFSGARTGILVIAEGQGSSVSLGYEHESLAKCVGEATAAFACELIQMNSNPLSSTIEPGIHFPEELPLQVRFDLFRNATLTSNFFDKM